MEISSCWGEGAVFIIFIHPIFIPIIVCMYAYFLLTTLPPQPIILHRTRDANLVYHLPTPHHPSHTTAQERNVLCPKNTTYLGMHSIALRLSPAGQQKENRKHRRWSRKGKTAMLHEMDPPYVRFVSESNRTKESDVIFTLTIHLRKGNRGRSRKSKVERERLANNFGASIKFEKSKVTKVTHAPPSNQG